MWGWFFLKYYNSFDIDQRPNQIGCLSPLFDFTGFEEIKIFPNDSILIKDELIHPNDFFEKIKSEISQQTSFIVTYSPEVIYEDFFFVLKDYEKALKDLRNEYSIKNYSKEYGQLSKEKSREIRIALPKMILFGLSESEKSIFDFFKSSKK